MIRLFVSLLLQVFFSGLVTVCVPILFNTDHSAVVFMISMVYMHLFLEKHPYLVDFFEEAVRTQK